VYKSEFNKSGTKMDEIEFLQNLEKSDLSKIGHRKIYDYIVRNISIPISTILIKEGTLIFRGRSENDILSFNSEFDISYRTDFGNIEKYGRCNKPNQSVFYGSIPQNRNDRAYLTPIFEIFPDFSDKFPNNFNRYITIGMWVVKKEIEVADIYNSSDFNRINLFKSKQQLWKNKLISDGIDVDEYNKKLSFFSKQFSKSNIDSHWDYKISSIYFDILLNNQIPGVQYPSVKRDYESNNIALTHHIIDEYLELKNAVVYELGNVVQPILFADDLGFMNSKFNWKKPEIGL
jgi:hypothetical protein